ncbi:MAG: NfeD family protein [Deltaproteobacteria bacterium]|nr:MAG: NfeD family protein [Deltaproteobacteria bacterium]
MVLSNALIWFLFGAGLLIAELMIPGIILVFFAAGCWISALVSLLIDITTTAQIGIFIFSSLVLLFTLRKFALNTFRGITRDQTDDHYADTKIGKTAIVTRAIHPHISGEIKVMGSFWMAVSDVDIEAGSSVMIEKQTSEDGLTFKVNPISGEKNE